MNFLEKYNLPLLIVGGAMAAWFVIKMVVIGYYEHELWPTMAIGVVGMGLLWLGNKGREAKRRRRPEGTAEPLTSPVDDQTT